MLLLSSDKKQQLDGWEEDTDDLLLSSAVSTSGASGASGGELSYASSDMTLGPHLHRGHRPHPDQQQQQPGQVQAGGIDAGDPNRLSGGSGTGHTLLPSSRTVTTTTTSSSRARVSHQHHRRSRSSRSYTPNRTKLSKRIISIHILHLVLVGIGALFVVVGAVKWDQDVGVPINKLSSFSSSLVLAFQTFFMGYVFLLYYLSREVAVDEAIRHPISLHALNAKLSGWSGLWAATVAVYHKIRSPKVVYLPSAVYIMVLYFFAGALLQLSASGILSVQVYNETRVMINPDSAVNHIGDYSGPEPIFVLDGVGDQGTSMSVSSNGLWRRARQNMFRGSVNDTRLIGLQGTLLHDVPNATPFAYDMVQVNGTKMNVRCSQAGDAFVQPFLLPLGSNDTTKAIRPDNNFFDPSSSAAYSMQSKTKVDESLWINVRLHAPPYWTKDSDDGTPQNMNVTSVWARTPYTDSSGGDSSDDDDDDDDDDYNNGGQHYLPTRIIVQDVAFLPNGPVGHQQIVFVLATGEPGMLLRDSSGDPGVHTNFTVTPGRDVDGCKATCQSTATTSTGGPSFDLTACQNDCYPTQMRAFVQVIGCDFWTEQVNVSLTPSNQLSYPHLPEPAGARAHRWGEFFWDWDDTTQVDMDRQFALIFGTPSPSLSTTATTVPSDGQWVLDTGRVPTSAENALRDSLKGKDVSGMEEAMEELVASYFYLYWQACDFPLPYEVMGYEECGVFRGGGDGSSSTSSSAAPSGTGTASAAESSSTASSGKYNSASYERLYTKARLEVVQWRAVTLLITSVLLAASALFLLGFKTDVRGDSGNGGGGDQDMRGDSFAEVVELLTESKLPDVMMHGGTGREDVALRYRPLHKEGGRLHHLDVP